MKKLFAKLKSTLSPDSVKIHEIYELLQERYRDRTDPWGLDLNIHKLYAQILYPFYKHYFRVRIHGQENIENRPYMMVSNHSGQVAIDGALIMMSMLFENHPPRIVRGMVERFLPAMPFLGEFVAHGGSILGDRKNCLYLLQQGETLLVFPEGVKGIAKNTSQFYKLQHFTTGFFRMALHTKTDILPIAVVGAEEFYPYVVHFKKLADWLSLPALPITPTFPWFGLLGLIPMPSPVDIYIGKPYKIPEDLSPEAPDKEINEHVYKIEQSIQDMINLGLKQKRNYLGIVSKYQEKNETNHKQDKSSKES